MLMSVWLSRLGSCAVLSWEPQQGLECWWAVWPGWQRPLDTDSCGQAESGQDLASVLPSPPNCIIVGPNFYHLDQRMLMVTKTNM